VILVDTSVWVEYLRDTDSPVVEHLRALLRQNADIRITEPIIMELLAGADTLHREAAISKLTNGLPLLPIDTALDYAAAAALFVAARKIGRRIRSLNDCLIAAIAVRGQAALFHNDRDFDELAKFTALVVHKA